MELTPEIVEYVSRIARIRARRLGIDQDIAVSLTYEYLLRNSEEVDDVDVLLARVHYLLKTRLLADFYDEIRVYGPRSTTLRQRRYRGKIPGSISRASAEHLHAVETRNVAYDFDFLDRLSPPLQNYALLILAGYTHTELINDFGFTRSKLDSFRQELSHVFAK